MKEKGNIVEEKIYARVMANPEMRDAFSIVTMAFMEAEDQGLELAEVIEEMMAENPVLAQAWEKLTPFLDETRKAVEQERGEGEGGD